MKKSFALLALAAIALCACTVQFEDTDTLGQEIIITASQEGGGQTRTVIQDGTTSVLWEPGDEMKLFCDGKGSRMVSQNTEPAGVASFAGTFNGVISFNEGFSSSTPLLGLYPYRADATADNTSITTTLPTEQTGKAGSFAKGMNICVAQSQSLKMGFYNVCGGVRFSLTQSGIKSVTFEGQDNEDLAGKVKIAFEDGIPVVKEVLEGAKSITLAAPNGGTFETGRWYYIVALPGTLPGGFKMTFNTDTQYATLKSSGSVTVKRGVFGSLADADEGLQFNDKEGVPAGEDIITFKDPIAKYACVEKFDKNGDGELSYAEAAAVTDITGLFIDWNTVTSFDELQYFTALTAIPDRTFSGLEKLYSVILPPTITTIGDGAFSGCSSLVSISLPSSIESIGTSAFAHSSLVSIILPDAISSISESTFDCCTSLESVTLPSSLKTIGSWAFSFCSALKTIDIPDGVTSIGINAFGDCRSLSTVTVPDSVTDFSWYVFAGCSSLTSATLPAGLTTIPEGTFSGCNLSRFVFGENLTEIESDAFSGCDFLDGDIFKVDIPASVTKIGRNNFTAARCVIVRSTQLVSIEAGAFGQHTKIYVPSNLVELYKVRANWSDYADRIFSIDDYADQKLIKEAVDLGLSISWASCNVGAFSPEEYGGYFAWGETEEKACYNWSTYFDSVNGNRESFKKYYKGGDKTVLDLEDDVANVEWGGSWRIPTDKEWQELMDNCSWEWMDNEANSTVSGWLVTGPNNNTIFLPAADSRYNTEGPVVGGHGLYWSSSLTLEDFSDYSEYVWCLYFDSSSFTRFYSNRDGGNSVRPVCD